jgi:hypothetical protein
MGLLNQYGLIRFSFIFEKSDEFKTVQNVIYDYRKEVEKREVPIEYRSTFLLFEGMMDNYDTFLDRVSYFWNLAIFIETLENKKFGIFLSDIIAPIKENEFQTESKNIIMYSTILIGIRIIVIRIGVPNNISQNTLFSYKGIVAINKNDTTNKISITIVDIKKHLSTLLNIYAL